MMYVLSFFTACVLSLSISGVIILLTKYYLPSVRRESGRKTTYVSRLGGVAMIFAFVGALFLHPDFVIDRQWWVLLGALGATAALGLWDDLSPLSWRPQLFMQVSIALFLFALGIRIAFVSNPFGEAGSIIHFASMGTFPWISLLVGLIWFIAVMNTMNWLDGIDGLGGGVALVGASAIYATALLPHVYQPPVAIAAAAMAGAIVGFLVWNWFPARIVAGTGGAFFWGLLIAVLAVFSGAKIATTLLVMLIPLIDAVWVIIQRLRSGDNIFAPDRRHIHYKLIDRGWSQHRIAFFLTAITAVIAVGSVGLGAFGKLITIMIVTSAVIAFLLYIEYVSPKKLL